MALASRTARCGPRALPKMPVCAVTSIGSGRHQRSLERSALAAGVMRKGSDLRRPRLERLLLWSVSSSAAGKADCELVVPDPMTSPSSKPKSLPAVWTTAVMHRAAGLPGPSRGGQCRHCGGAGPGLCKKGHDILGCSHLEGLAAVENRRQRKIRVLSPAPGRCWMPAAPRARGHCPAPRPEHGQGAHLSAVIGLAERKGRKPSPHWKGLTAETQKKTAPPCPA